MGIEDQILKLRAEQAKRAIRSQIRYRADLLQTHQSAFNVERFNESLILFLAQQEGCWAAFRGMGYEPRLDKAIWASRHLNWVYPRMAGEELEFLEGTDFVTNSWGVDEPTKGKLVPADKIQGFLIPGIAFDRQGGRLGRGKGYYDRALTSVLGQKIGVCFAFQLVEGQLPCESFDVRMNIVVTEQGAYHVGGI